MQDASLASPDATRWQYNLKESEACGYPGQTFRGDCFVGRVFDDTQAAPTKQSLTCAAACISQDEWRRMDFTLKALEPESLVFSRRSCDQDCSTDAHWVHQTKLQRTKRTGPSGVSAEHVHH